MTAHCRDISEIEAVVGGFEACTTSKDDFSHRSHLTVAVYYLHELSEPQATEKIRAGLLRFLDHHGVGRAKFHETLTVFWIKSVVSVLQGLDPNLSLPEITNAVFERLGSSPLVSEYYSRERLQSDEARNRYVEPDLKPL